MVSSFRLFSVLMLHFHYTTLLSINLNVLANKRNNRIFYLHICYFTWVHSAFKEEPKGKKNKHCLRLRPFTIMFSTFFPGISSDHFATYDAWSLISKNTFEKKKKSFFEISAHDMDRSRIFYLTPVHNAFKFFFLGTQNKGNVFAAKRVLTSVDFLIYVAFEVCIIITLTKNACLFALEDRFFPLRLYKWMWLRRACFLKGIIFLDWTYM